MTTPEAGYTVCPWTSSPCPVLMHLAQENEGFQEIIDQARSKYLDVTMTGVEFGTLAEIYGEWHEQFVTPNESVANLVGKFGEIADLSEQLQQRFAEIVEKREACIQTNNRGMELVSKLCTAGPLIAKRYIVTGEKVMRCTSLFALMCKELGHGTPS